MPYKRSSENFTMNLNAELEQFILEEFVNVMRLRGHKIEFYGDEIMTEKV